MTNEQGQRLAARELRASAAFGLHIGREPDVKAIVARNLIDCAEAIPIASTDQNARGLDLHLILHAICIGTTQAYPQRMNPATATTAKLAKASANLLSLQRPLRTRLGDPTATVHDFLDTSAS